MSPSVAGKWSRKGFTAATAIIPKAQRDAKPCNGNFNLPPQYVLGR